MIDDKRLDEMTKEFEVAKQFLAKDSDDSGIAKRLREGQKLVDMARFALFSRDHMLPFIKELAMGGHKDAEYIMTMMKRVKSDRLD